MVKFKSSKENWEYHKPTANFEACTISDSVSNSLVADIRNKLSSPKNLCAMLKDRQFEPFINEKLNEMVSKEIEQTLKNIEYLSNL